MKIKFHTNSKKNDSLFLQEQQDKLHQYFINTINEESVGFFHITDNKEHIKKAVTIYNKFNHKKHFIQIGIGGSSLGPKMLIDALSKNEYRTFTFLDNTDSDYIYDELSKISLVDSLFYVVSKSGATAETMAIFAICRNLLSQAGISEDDYNQYFVFSTDPLSSDLKELSDEKGFNTLVVPTNIGGRFSVLTSVGLLPALFANIDIKRLYEGANSIKEELLSKDITNPLLKTATELAYAYNQSETQVNQTVLMPYSSKLKNLSHWFVQLWGESLGKYSQEKKMHTGLTPIPAYGATDQHSQMQLFMEGPNDKFILLIDIENRSNDFSLDNTIGKKSSNALCGYTLNQLIKAQLNGTLKALKDKKRNVALISIKENDEYNIGRLILFLESLTCLMGYYLSINPFDQPGVELGKKYAYEYLAKEKLQSIE